MRLLNIWKHFQKIHTHRKWVQHYCFLVGIPWQGITHDLSKYSPTEFWESVKYYQGNRSPINAAKEDQGYSLAWLHHKGRNKHHYQYWMDDFDKGGRNILMPKKYFKELICDYLGAAHAYKGIDFTYYNEKLWWKQESQICAMNPKLKEAVTYVINLLALQEEAYYLDFYCSPEQLLKDGLLDRAYEKYCEGDDK